MPLPPLKSPGGMGGPGGISPATADLGLGTMLADQVSGETEEQRKKRMLAMMQQSKLMPGASGAAASPASLALFGGMGAIS